MKKFAALFATAAILLFQGCKTDTDQFRRILEEIRRSVYEGSITRAVTLSDSVIRSAGNSEAGRVADSLKEIAQRIPLDFTLTEEQVIQQLGKRLGDKFNAADMSLWEEKKWLESRLIDGEKRYFKRAASNLILLKNFNLEREKSDSAAARSTELVSRKKHTAEIISASEGIIQPAVPRKIEITYTITVNPDAVPPGEIIRCWLPYPKEGHPRQKEVYLLGVSDENYFVLSPDSVIHRTIYMEKKAEAGKATVFSIAWSYNSSGQYFDPEKIKIQSYDKNSGLYRKYTAEQPPQINFSERVRNTADSITGFETNPYEILKKIYYWFSDNIPWAGALEYSIMHDIPEYVLENRKGDCGMQTFLLISMLRYKGVPVRWQSGWMVPPGFENLHDWCEVYFEGTGWVPVDISYGLQYSSDKKTREFYITGIDSYRLIVNDGISGELYPAKKFLRSEPYDFQRGEVEWNGGNLYFDKWDYDIKIEYK
jgi:hypothetical protein